MAIIVGSKIGSRKPTEVNPGVDASPTNMGVSADPEIARAKEADEERAKEKAKEDLVSLTKEELAAESKTPYKSTAPKKKATQTEGSKARAQIERMKTIYNSGDTYKKGGVVKSGASRGDGCAIKGRTKGKYC